MYSLFYHDKYCFVLAVCLPQEVLLHPEVMVGGGAAGSDPSPSVKWGCVIWRHNLHKTPPTIFWSRYPIHDIVCYHYSYNQAPDPLWERGLVHFCKLHSGFSLDRVCNPPEGGWRGSPGLCPANGWIHRLGGGSFCWQRAEQIRCPHPKGIIPMQPEAPSPAPGSVICGWLCLVVVSEEGQLH